MRDVTIAFPALALIRVVIAAVWLYEGLWCKIFGRARLEAQVVASVPKIGPQLGGALLKALGAVEVALGVWVISGTFPGICAISQMALLIALNVNGLVWARRIIPDPAGMVLKNSAFLVLVWWCGAIPARP